ncbi:MAG: hypothetical protein U9N86_02090 [Bacteroidota bacterium]|nr:hypothetical protein [Bacteroidota bacterium]
MRIKSNYKTAILISIISLLLFPGFSVSYAQVEDDQNAMIREKAIKVFLDMRGRWTEHIKSEIPFINYVRDRKQAQVYIMQTSRSTGANGSEYTIALIGQKEFESVNDTLIYISKASDTDEMTRSEIIKVLKRGLMRYVGKTPLAEYITIDYKISTEPAEVIDKWNYWVFSSRFSYDMSARSSRDDFEIDGSFSADRVTPELKTSFYLGSNYEKRKYKFSSGETYTSISRSQNFRGMIVKSINNHLSVGGYTSANSSYYSNTKFAFELAPAIEYNIFPYSVSTRREFRFLYKAAYRNIYYEEETIYLKTHENLFSESLSASFELKERWGSLRANLEGSHFFHDFSKFSFDISGYMNLRIFEGFSMDISAGYSAIRDQLALRKGGATETEIFLHQKEIANNYRMYADIGFRYTFGSIYSNVVNPRFGGGRRGRH